MTGAGGTFRSTPWISDTLPKVGPPIVSAMSAKEQPVFIHHSDVDDVHMHFVGKAIYAQMLLYYLKNLDLLGTRT